jgi:hypothetical protein
MIIWSTKNALTKGIEKVEVEMCKGSSGMCAGRVDGLSRYFHKEGYDWHRTYQSAMIRAEKMRADKLASLGKQYTKVEGLYFGLPCEETGGL